MCMKSNSEEDATCALTGARLMPALLSLSTWLASVDRVANRAGQPSIQKVEVLNTLSERYRFVSASAIPLIDRMGQKRFISIFVATLFTATFLVDLSSSLKEGQICVADSNCDSGLHCETCIANGNVRPRCTRIKPINPTSQVKGLPFNRYSWLTTHNAFARLGQRSATGSIIVAPSNQQDSITDQLNNGIRGLMLDMYDFQNDIWLCHSFGGQCYNYTAFQPAINVLKEIQSFLVANPTEIVTIIIEDYVTSPKGLTKVFDAAGLRKYWFPVSRMPTNGGDWPTVDDMVQKSQRLLVLLLKQEKRPLRGLPTSGDTW
ncbi:hypothetical protein FNV43_RR22674 [Rhamnella rubrinervis]|uniref:Uncharacterized protein n=1 Tax=Rhamnella rubrinervis TaxID=2594499 RepID=A0A8K0DWM1_9ROSA|nr:hypothetical protein FNV43_RR22674 [Rhamnella rubrinervis]